MFIFTNVFDITDIQNRLTQPIRLNDNWTTALISDPLEVHISHVNLTVFDWVGEVGSEGATDAEYFLVLLQSGHSQGLGVATSTHRHKPRLKQKNISSRKINLPACFGLH